jgi:hypothetical protein
MNQFNSEQYPDNPDDLPPARRRRARRLLAPLDADERAAYLDSVAHRASPSFDFFLFSLLSGAVIGAGFLFDSTALLLLGALLAPLMAPAVGLALGTVIGSVRFFIRSLTGVVIGSLLVFLVGLLTGYAARPWLPLSFAQAHQYTQLSWANFLVLALGTCLTSIAMVRPHHNASLPSVALVYELYLPLTAAGIGLGSAIPYLWPDGLVVYAVYLAWSALLGALTLAVMGFRPLTLFGYTLSGAMALLGIILLIGMTGAGAAWGAQIALPTPIPTATPTITLTPTLTLTPVPPTDTLTPLPPTDTPTPTVTLTLTPTPSPTPVLALVAAGEGGGAFLRAQAGLEGVPIVTLTNGTLVQVLPDEFIVKDGYTWVHVQAPDGKAGWMLEILLVIATPAPGW